MVSNIHNKINLIRKTIKLVVDPPPPPIMANADTGEKSHYFIPADTHALVNIKPTNMGPQLRLHDNSTMSPQ